ncbi:unnamed protein product [Dibothriocephalus latus]|uniref:Uncharacterized protein n=1 Tax=Dibothriocephalus latus TaxID=60516 RepID=A0A3P7LHI4_DIBLA|nr:unnamed protein product [Dibothriocephalus latus]
MTSPVYSSELLILTEESVWQMYYLAIFAVSRRAPRGTYLVLWASGVPAAGFHKKGKGDYVICQLTFPIDPMAGTAPHTTAGEDGGDSKEEAAATQQEGLSDAATAALSKKKRPKRTEKATRQTRKSAAKSTMTPKEVPSVPSSSAPQVDLDEEDEQPKSQLADPNELEIPAAPAANQLSASETPCNIFGFWDQSVNAVFIGIHLKVTTAARKRVHSKSFPEVNGSLNTNDVEGLETADVTVAVNSKKRKVTLPSVPSQAAAAVASPNARPPSPKQANGVRTLKNASNLRQADEATSVTLVSCGDE